MNSRTTVISVIAALGIVALAYVYLFPHALPLTQQPLASVSYACKGGKTISAAYYKGDAKPAPRADLPPTPGGYVDLVLSDGRSMSLPQTLSADGGRYANADESFVFWTKGNGALVLENNTEKSYIGCILVAPLPEGSALTKVYSNSGDGFSIRLPEGYVADESYAYQGMGPGRDIGGVKFTIPAALSHGTNLAEDTYISVEELPRTATCQAGLFLDRGTATEVQDGEVTYSVASSTGAGAGNRYEETVYALPGTNPCVAVRYFIHYGVIENYPAGAVRQFDAAALMSEFDAIRRTLIINQSPS